MFVSITIIGQTWQGHQAQPPCAKPAVRTTVANKGNEDTLPT